MANLSFIPNDILRYDSFSLFFSNERISIVDALYHVLNGYSRKRDAVDLIASSSAGGSGRLG
ncbi:MAG: hypothetical protein HY026_04725 [Deltaproteobacteria bacterium]|nr:hypothetical protein [Deltaproteobacteria bacterium]